MIARAAKRAAEQEARRQKIILLLPRAQSKLLSTPPAQVEPKIDWEKLLPLVPQLRKKYREAVQLCIMEKKSRDIGLGGRP